MSLFLLQCTMTKVKNTSQENVEKKIKDVHMLNKKENYIQ